MWAVGGKRMWVRRRSHTVVSEVYLRIDFPLERNTTESRSNLLSLSVPSMVAPKSKQHLLPLV